MAASTGWTCCASRRPAGATASPRRRRPRPRPGGRRMQAAQALDVADWLPNDLLIKLDRCLMAHGVEGRTPLLDAGVAAAAFRLPDALKVQGHTGKWLLRQWLAKHLPAAQPFAPKQGFTVPVGAWIERVGDRLGPLVAAQAGVAEIARPDQGRRAVPPCRRREAPRLRGVAPAVLRAVAPPAYRGAAGRGRRVRGAVGAVGRRGPAIPVTRQAAVVIVAVSTDRPRPGRSPRVTTGRPHRPPPGTPAATAWRRFVPGVIRTGNGARRRCAARTAGAGGRTAQRPRGGGAPPSAGRARAWRPGGFTAGIGPDGNRPPPANRSLPPAQ